MDTTFKIGDLVWAKMKGYPSWPGRVSRPTKDVKRPPLGKAKTSHCIFFFGTNNYAWIDQHSIHPYAQEKDKLEKTCKSGQLKTAFEAIEKFIEGGECFDEIAGAEPNPEDLFDKLKEEDGASSPSVSVEKKTPKIKPKKDTPKVRKSEGGRSVGRPAKKAKIDSDHSSSNRRFGSMSPAMNHSTPLRKTASLLDRPTNIVRPDTPPLDVETPTATLKEKNIQPSTMKFGFLGLGIMGGGIVKNLLNSGHKVIIWNRTQEKCNDFVKAGAEQCLTPADVVSSADITFSCVSDPQAAKDMVFGNCGVLSEISVDKGYVEMTGIDPETSQDIAEAVMSKGARYLEAQVQGSKVQAEQGTLITLCAGDRQLFDECNTCFKAMAKTSFFLGDVGAASKMNLVLQLLAGVTLAGLAECMALAYRAGLQNEDVVDILSLTGLACPAILEKARAIIKGGFSTHHSLKHMQKDLRMSLEMSDQLEQPVPLTATANEVYKHAKRLGYSEHDSSAVYIRAKF